MKKSLPFRSLTWRGAGKRRAIHYIYRGAENLWASGRRVNGIRGGEPMGFGAEGQWALWRRANGIHGGEQMGFAANIKRAKAPPREGEAFAVRCLAVPMAGARRCPSVSSRCTRASYLVTPKRLISFHPSVSSRFSRAFHLVAPECFISFQPSVSSCFIRVFHLVAPGGLMSGETGTFSPSAPTAGEGRALLPLHHDALDEYVAREQRGGDDEGAIVLEILWGEEA